MTIKKVNIIAFGGLKNISLDFSDRFNCIYGENEDGKTTIMSFIKMMFYGNEHGGSQISKNIRKKYTPWDGSQMAGSVEFEINGRNYRLEREFKASNASDRVTLTDLDLGVKEAVPGDIGKKLFGLSNAAFERSIFIGQLGFPSGDPAAESEINARLSNIISSGDEQISYEKVKSRLETARYVIISKSGRTGEYPKNIQKISELKERLDSSVSAQKRYYEGKEKLLSHISKTNELAKKAENLKEKLSKEQDIRNANKLRELLAAKAELDRVNESLKLNDGTLADEDFKRKLQFCISKIEKAKQQIKQKQFEADSAKNQIEAIQNAQKNFAEDSPEKIAQELNELNEGLEKLKAKKADIEQKIATSRLNLSDSKVIKKKFNLPLLIAGILLIILSVIPAAAKNIPLFLILAAAGLVTALLGFIVKPSDNKRIRQINEELAALEAELSSLTAEQAKITEQITEKRTRLETINLALNSNSEVIEKLHDQMVACEGDIEKLEALKNEYNTQLMALVQKLGTDTENIDEILQRLNENSAKQREIKQQINFLLRDLNSISYEKAEKKLKEIENSTTELSADFPQMKAEYEKIQAEITERRSAEAAAAAELKNLISNCENPEKLEKELAEIQKTAKAQKEFCDAADIALEVLLESFAQLRQSFGSKLEKTAAEIFSKLTNNRYGRMTISKSFDINVEESGTPLSRESDFLSSGTVDQAYLSLRLAISKLLSDKTVLPVFLDDALTQYDDKRMQNAINFLKELSSNGQIIMFTCHKSICDYAADVGSTIINLKN